MYEFMLKTGFDKKSLLTTNANMSPTNGPPSLSLWLQDILFYATNRLNLSIRTLQIPKDSQGKGWIMLSNGSWTRGIGVLQRKEADICSSPTGTQFNKNSHSRKGII